MGVESVDKLTTEEKVDFDRWHKILSDGEVTVEKIQRFCVSQKHLIETDWANLNNSKEKNERLIIAHTIYTKLLGVIEQPQSEKEALEKHLNSLLLDEI